ncbi:PrpF domain-containing protein [Actinomadura sp. NBRC 104412]|uniref:PrpF domain-containing protein n=1 Tax=Actinomadura sp. NBRC 104412 TaxID=3032203 RepID=UPI002556E6DD|nr:PrpF domain-containing protein [Actinomadura sp. NBRC 104412]
MDVTSRPGGAGVRCALMRGGTSKGAFFLAGDLPAATGTVFPGPHRTEDRTESGAPT